MRRATDIEKGDSAFTLATPNGVAHAGYYDEQRHRVFFHTDVPLADRGRGFATVLIAEALRRTKAEGLKIVATCPFVKSYLARHATEA